MNRLARIESLEDRALLTTIDLSQPAVNITNLFGAATFDNAGRSVSNAGDVNGDGFDDVIVGARSANGTTGESYVVFGGPNLLGTSIDFANLGNAGIVIHGVETSDASGRSVSAAGDVNGDGFDDLLIGAYYGGGAVNGRPGSGESYLIFGGANLPSSISLNELGSAGVVIYGADPGDYSGYSVSAAGDVNGDGFDDIIIGAYYGNGAGNATQDAGEAYIIFGAAVFPQTIDLANLGTAGIVINGIDPSDHTGTSVSNAGDVNGDGFDDVIIGSPEADAFGNAKNQAGETYIIFGGASLPSTINLANLGSGGVVIFGADALDGSGGSVSNAGDVNGDGFDDVLIGAHYADGQNNAHSACGDSYVIFGGPNLPQTIDLATLGNAGIVLSGIDNNDHSGRSVSDAGDVNGDGFDDFIIGAPAASGINNAKSGVGESYLIFGGAALPSTISLGSLSNSAGITIVGIDANDRLGYSSIAAGDVNGDGYSDLVLGAVGAASLNNGRPVAGEAYIIYGSNVTNSVTHPGGTGDDALTGTAAANVINGAAGNDTLVGNGGADVIYGGQGNDTIAVPDTTFKRLNGGNGIDTLRIDGAGVNLDLTAIANNRISNFEVIDIRGSGANTLTLNLSEVLHLAHNSNPDHTVNTLRVRRGADDTVNIGAGWTTGSVQSVDGVLYQTYTQGTATLLVENALPLVTLSISGSAMSEAGGTATVTATLSGISSSDVTVTLGFSGTATFPADYSRSGTQIVIPAGSLAGTVTLTAEQDGDFEPNDTIIVDITDVTNGLEDGVQQVTKLIVDDDHAPVFTSTSTPSVAENSTAVLNVVATDADLPAQTITYSITGGVDQGKFSINSTGALSFAVAPDFENPGDADADNVYEVQVTADDGHGGVTSQSISVTVTDVNESLPTVTLGISDGAMVEAGGTATVTATLSATTNVDVTVTLGFSGTATFPDDYSRSNTQIVIPAGSLTGTVTLTAVQDAEFDPDETIVVDITDVTNAVENGSQQVTKQVTDDDHAPAFTTTATPSVPENTTTVLTVVATDADVPAQTITYAIVGGADQARFSISSTGALAFNTAPDFENPTDVGANNVYEVQVQADDGHGGVTTQNISVTVTDVDEDSFLSVNGPAATWIKKQPPVNVLPQAIAQGVNLGGGSLVISVNVVGTKKKLLDQFQFPSTSSLGTSAGPQSANGQLTLEIDLAPNTTAAAVQAFLRGITFSTKGKGLKVTTRTLTATLTNADQQVGTLTQTINVRKKA